MSIDSQQIERIKTSWMMNGVHCWVKVSESEKSKLMYRKAIITGLDNKREHAFLNYDFNIMQIEQQKEKGLDKVHVRDLLECNQNADNERNKDGFQDMVGMNVLNEAEILHNIWLRYTKHQIFTYIGPTLIVINPYMRIDNLFNQNVMEQFQKPAINNNFDMKAHQPHVYAVTTLAYQQLFMNQKNQAIVISGESGAGKTENAKYAMNFLTSLSKCNNQKSQRNKRQQNNGPMSQRYQSIVNQSSTYDDSLCDQHSSNKEISIEERIMRCNPILEAFGNAKTVRNDNSSRFGKYVRIWIGRQDKKIKGASLTNYLLEKSRVTLLSQSERNYHIFYHFLAGFDINKLKEYQMVDQKNQRIEMKTFNYLNQSNIYELATLGKDQDMMNQIIESFDKMDIDSYQQKAIYKVISAILYIGNIEIDSSTYTDNTPCTIKNQNVVKIVSDLLGIDDTEKISKSIIFKIRQVGSQVMESPLNLEECKTNRDSLARALYDKMFTWIVQALNMQILPHDMSPVDCFSLGLLDIFGFENFDINSFEQFCINYTNEKLQQLYIIYVFKAEQEEFKNEGLKVYNFALSYQDNQQIMDVMDKYPIGIFDLLDESCSLGNSTDEKFYQKVVQTYAKNENIKIPKIQNMKFSIVHTAKEVEYTTEGFRNKNKDEISQFLDSCIQSSENSEIISIWQGIDDGLQSELESQMKQFQENQYSLRQSIGGGRQNTQSDFRCSVAVNKKVDNNKGKNAKFLGAKFRAQMKDLMGELNCCDVHFIRCIKPNEEKVKNLFNSHYVLQQIRYLGVLESIKVRREGFPCRISYEDFYTKYHELDVFNRKIPLQRHLDMKQDMKGLCKELLFRVVKDINKKEVMFGETKIYLKVEPSAELDSRLLSWWQFKNKQATKIQNQWEVYNYRKVVKQNLKAIKNKVAAFTKLQATFKMKKARQAYQKKVSNFKKGVQILQDCFQKAKQTQISSVFQKLTQKVRANKTNLSKQNAINLICKLGKKQDIKDIREYWKRWKEFIKQQSEENNKKQQEQNNINSEIIQEINKEQNNEQLQQQNLQNDDDQEEEEKKDEVKELQEVTQSNPIQKKKINPNGIEMESEDIKSDEFSSQGLKIWPNFSNFTKPQGLKDKFSIPNDTFENPQTFINVLEPQQKEKVNLEFSDQFILKIKQNSFLEYCDKNVKRAKNFSKKTQISKIMQYQTTNLNESLLNSSDSFNSESTKIFRSLLKIAGNRNSRFSPRYHSDLIISMCYGRENELDEYGQVIGKSKVENPEDSNKGRIKKNSKEVIDYDKRRESNLAKYQSNIAQKVLSENQDNLDNNYKDEVFERQKQLLQNDLNNLRDECYFQICKQISGNKSIESKKNLLNFVAELSNLFAPSQSALFPLLNFFMDLAETEQNPSHKDDAKYIVQKLSEYARNYAIVKSPNPYQIPTNKILQEDLIYKQNDPLEVDLKKMDNTSLFKKYLWKTETRQLIPSMAEIQKIHNKQEINLKIYLFNNTFIWIPVESLETVKLFIEKVSIKIDMKERQQFFSLYETKIEEGHIEQEQFLKDSAKIMDVYNSQRISSDLAFKKHGRVVEFKIYLRIRIYYKLFKDDIDSINMFYMQNIFEVNQGRLPLTQNQIISLAAHFSYSIIHSNSIKEEGGGKDIKNIISQSIPKYVLYNQNQDKLIEEIKEVYDKLQYKNVIEARWMYLEIIRPLDLFLTYQFECKMFEQEKTEQGYKLKSIQQVVFGIRPLQIIVSDKNRKTLLIIDFSELMKWGQSLNNNSYFLIQHENGLLYVFEIQDTDLADYLINAYVNWKLEKNIDESSNPTYNDVVTFLIHPEQDKNNQIK